MSDTQPDEDPRRLNICGRHYDIMDDTEEIPEAEVPAPAEILRKDPGPSNTVVMQTRHKIYIRSADGKMSKLKLGDGVDLEELRRQDAERRNPEQAAGQSNALVSAASEKENLAKKAKPVKETAAGVSKKLELFTAECNSQFEKTAGELSSIRELLQTCLDAITKQAGPPQVGTPLENDPAKDTENDGEDENAEDDNDYISVSEAERNERRRRRKKKSPGLNFTAASASTRIDGAAKKPATAPEKYRSTIRDGSDPSSSSADESDAREESPISSILAGKNCPNKNRTTTFILPLAVADRTNPAVKDVPRKESVPKETITARGEVATVHGEMVIGHGEMTIVSAGRPTTRTIPVEPRHIRNQIQSQWRPSRRNRSKRCTSSRSRSNHT